MSCFKWNTIIIAWAAAMSSGAALAQDLGRLPIPPRPPVFKPEPIHDEVEALDEFGDALASGDFNGDGVQDLAIGVPGERAGERLEAGAAQLKMPLEFWRQRHFLKGKCTMSSSALPIPKMPFIST